MKNPNADAAKWFAIGIGIFVYATVVIYSDVMFITVVSGAIPNGILGFAAIAGAFAIGLTGLALPLALHFWLSPGKQFWIGILCWLADTAILVLNCVLAFAISTNSLDPWMAKYKEICPAAPVVAIILWGVIFLSDDSHKLRHAQSQLASAQIAAYTSALIAESNNEEVLEEARRQAKLAAREGMIQITGKSLRPASQQIEAPRNTVQGSGYAVPSPIQQSQQSVPVQEPQQSIFGKIGSIFTGKQELRTQDVMSSSSDSTPVHSDSWHSQVYGSQIDAWVKAYEQSDMSMSFPDFIAHTQATRPASQSPLQSPQLDATQASHEGMNGNSK
jgi:hypothetical protein